MPALCACVSLSDVPLAPASPLLPTPPSCPPPPPCRSSPPSCSSQAAQRSSYGPQVGGCRQGRGAKRRFAVCRQRVWIGCRPAACHPHGRHSFRPPHPTCSPCFIDTPPTPPPTPTHPPAHPRPPTHSPLSPADILLADVQHDPAQLRSYLLSPGEGAVLFSLLIRVRQGAQGWLFLPSVLMWWWCLARAALACLWGRGSGVGGWTREQAKRGSTVGEGELRATNEHAHVK